MADAASACRRTTRASQQPLSLAEEQAAVTLSALEQRDVAAALRLSLQDSWDSDEEKSGAERDAEAESSSSEEEEEKQAAAPAEEEEEWTDNLHAVDVPLPRLRHERQPAPAAASGTALIPRGAHARACSADASRAEASPSKQATRTRRFTSQGSLPRARADAKRLRAVQPTIRKASTILVHLSHLPSTSLLQRLLRIVSRVERNCASHDIIKA